MWGAGRGARPSTQELDLEIGSRWRAQGEGSLSGGKGKHWIKEVMSLVFIINLWTPKDR